MNITGENVEAADERDGDPAESSGIKQSVPYEIWTSVIYLLKKIKAIYKIAYLPKLIL